MNEIWKKTSLLYKMIALLLTVVMVGTTLYFHFEKKYVAKAEGEGTIEVFAAYIDGDATSTTYGGESGWQRVESGIKVANNDNRCFAYFIVVPNSITNLDKIFCTVDGNEPDYENNKIDLSSTFGLTGYKDDCRIYKIDETYGNNNAFKGKYALQSSAATDLPTAQFDWLTTTGVMMTAKIGDTDVDANSFNSLGKMSTMTVDITSPSELTSFTVFGEDKKSELGAPVYNKQSMLYKYSTYTYNFGDNGAITKYYSDKSVSVSDGTNTVTKTANSIKYDGTNPAVTAKVNGNNLDSNKWYGAADGDITFTIKSGEGDSESNLKSVSIKDGDTDVDCSSFTSNSNSEYTQNVSFSNGTHTVVISTEDMAGNLKNESYTIKVDKEKPSIVSIDVSSKNTVGGINYVKLNDDKNVLISGTVSEEYSGIKENGLFFEETKKSSSSTPNYYIIEGEASPYSYSIDLGKIIGSNVDFSNHQVDGEYSVKVTPTDNAGNVGDVSEEITFVLDTYAPSVGAPAENETVIEVHDTNGWHSVPESTIENGKYLVNKVLYDKIRFKVKVKDGSETSGDNFYKVEFKRGSETKQNYETKADGDIYYYELPMTDIGTTSALEHTVVATDKALNVTTFELPKLQEVNSDLTLSVVSIKYNGTAISGEIDSVDDLTSIFATNPIYNGLFTVTVKARSGYPINEIVLKKNTEEYKKYDSVDGLTNNQDSTTGLYSTNEVTFSIPSSNINEMLNSMSIYVEDSLSPTPNTKNIPIGDLLYDRTQPVVVNNSSLDTNKWYQEYTLNYELKSGEDVINVPESILTSASYAIDGGAASSIDVSSSVKSKTGSVDIPESKSIAGTKIVFDAKDKATNTIDTASVNYPNSITVKVDKTAPKVDGIKVNGESVSEEKIIAGNPQLTSTITDNLTVKDYSVTVKYNDDAYAIYPVSVEKDASEEAINHTLQQLLGSKELKDGKYTVSVSARDKSERTSNVSSTSFVVDNTVPVLGASIISGTTGKNNGYYNTDVVVRLTCKDNNFNPSAMTVTDNGSAINANWQVGNDIYYADVTLSSEGLHDIRVTGNDKAGTAAEAKQVTFIIDKTVPTVSLLVNGGQVYNESRGTLNLTGPLTLTASVSDTNEDAGDLRVQIIKTVPDTATSTSEFLPTGERTFSFADEADYVVNIFAIDKANNQGPTRTISFRVDTTAPQLTITGANGGTASSATSVSFNITEAFWSDAKGTVEIYRKAGDGVDEALYKTLTISPTQRAYSLSELLRESGIYRFEFTADDKVGHTATASQKITVDVNKPEITLSGVNNYDSTDGAVSISAIIKDEFYASKKVSIQGTRTDAAGKKTALSFSPFAATANPTTINDTFSEEGIYDITLTATDIAGNVTSNSVHFTIDTSKPVIGDLSKYDGKTFNAKTFEELGLDINLDELVSDLTVCQVRMYLNGSEYDGMADIEDGSYTLLITAEDELGHKSEKSATFVLDTKEPIFIVTGVEDGEIRNDNYNIEVSLQLDEDTLDEVKLNDKVITVKNNVATFDVTDKGEYELYMKATDEAGNEASQTIKFTFGEESVATAVSNAVEKAASHWWLWAIVVAAVLAVGGFIFFILKRRNED